MNCPDAMQWSDYLEGELRPREFDILRKHAAGCEPCARQLETLTAEDELLRAALKPAPNLDDFTSDILRRLRDGGED